MKISKIESRDHYIFLATYWNSYKFGVLEKNHFWNLANFSNLFHGFVFCKGQNLIKTYPKKTLTTIPIINVNNMIKTSWTMNRRYFLYVLKLVGQSNVQNQRLNKNWWYRINGHVKSLYAWIHKSTFVGYLHDNIQLKIPNFDGSPLIKHQPMWKPTNE
jgi:hypothetical protein